MDEQIILSCDEQGNFKGYIKKSVGHTGKGQRHRAITVLIQNSKSQVLIQKRKHKLFDNLLDITASTHPLLLENRDETDEEASLRALEVEYGIKKNEVKNLKTVGAINYFAQYGEHCEHEHDIILVGEYDGKINLNKNTAYGYLWMDKQDFLEDVQKNPQNYTPWTVEAVKILKK